MGQYIGKSERPECSKGHPLTHHTEICKICTRAHRRAMREGQELVTCALCGERLRMLGNHVLVHGVSIREYRERFPGTPTMAADLREIWSAHGRDKNLDRVGIRTPDGLIFQWEDQERIGRAIQYFTRQRGRAPKTTDWPTPTERYPSSAQVARAFGSFAAGLRYAGVWEMRRRKKMKHKAPYRNRATSEADILSIRHRAAAGEPLLSLARAFQKDRSSIDDIVRGRTYRDISGPRIGLRRAPPTPRSIVVAIRQAYENGERVCDIARHLDLPYRQVYDIAIGRRRVVV